ncbi:reverse transcriptase-like protein [Sphingomonas mucosissima]|uniref:RNase H type-1 domain-containing protein n=1 Tax=Sphingomonas mucosissima TaxID=370959 RepID=A0A245ZRK8_9SPHN|nr:reverse transcriptase-like protein [Sphingomonas mucosissima]OWK32379.1 hypothetical protein SPMU_07040 [Sphingomonas mucosissima]
MKIFFDGGLRPAPHGMELAVVAAGRSHIERGLGSGTSMEAEWLALIAAMRLAKRLALTDAVLLGDAAAVIAQASGRVKVPQAHLAHFACYMALPRPARFRLRHIKRTQNLAGIALEKTRTALGA